MIFNAEKSYKKKERQSQKSSARNNKIDHFISSSSNCSQSLLYSYIQNLLIKVSTI